MAILPNDGILLNTYKEAKIAFKKFNVGESYNSASNQYFLSIEDIRNLIRKHIDSSFKPF